MSYQTSIHFDPTALLIIKNEVDKAKAIAGIGSVIINSAKLEIDYLKATGKIDTQSDIFKSVISPKSIE